MSFIFREGATDHNAGGPKDIELGTNRDHWYEDDFQILCLQGVVIDEIVVLSTIGSSVDFSGWCRATQSLAVSSGFCGRTMPWDTLCAGRYGATGRIRNTLLERDSWKTFRHALLEKRDEQGQHLLKDSLTLQRSYEIGTESDRNDEARSTHDIWARVHGRRFAITQTKRTALVNQNAQTGDRLCIFPGGKVPFVLRRRYVEGAGAYGLIGDCYVHGVMDGGALHYPIEKVRIVINLENVQQS